MVAEENTLDDLFEDTLKDIYYAETRSSRRCRRWRKRRNRTSSKPLSKSTCRKPSATPAGKGVQADRRGAEGQKCEAIEGIIDEGTEIMKD